MNAATLRLVTQEASSQPQKGDQCFAISKRGRLSILERIDLDEGPQSFRWIRNCTDAEEDDFAQRTQGVEITMVLGPSGYLRILAW